MELRIIYNTRAELCEQLSEMGFVPRLEVATRPAPEPARLTAPAQKPVPEVVTPAPAPEPALITPAPEPEPEPALSEIVEKAKELKNAQGRTVVQDILEQFGIARLKALPEDQYQACYHEIEAKLNA